MCFDRYELPRARRLHHGRDSRRDEVSTDDTFRQTLSPTATDILIETEISVSPSDAAELRTILEYRADRAVVDDAS